ncbi:hypothetical protein GCM10023333_31370 [Ferrimonas pelagia]|uniref:TnsE C-terminal domain-containing protein n=2 Tax=Ferrimonas pelagia TaxID=1177826 RepID=A0ABP9F7G8_9GAMM
MHGLLDSEFEVLEEPGGAQINVLQHSGYGVTHFEDPDNRRVLSWVLLDAEARRSFESIAQHELLEGIERGGYRLWDFSFTPPSLPGTHFDVRGHLDKESRSYFVFEVLELSQIPVSMPSKIGMYHPEFEQKVRSNGQTGTSKAEAANLLNVQNGFEAVQSASRQRIETEKTTVSFSKAFVVHRSPGKQRAGAGAKTDSEEPTEPSRDLSVEDSAVTGSLPAADWDSFDDQTDDAHLYLGRFKAFLDMVNELEVQHGVTVVRRDLRKLPELPRCKKHLLSTDGSHRHLAVIDLDYQGMCFTLLEVDTSDADKQLSTKLLKKQGEPLAEAQLFEVEKQLLKGSLSWPKALFDQYCGKDQHRWIPHPKSKHKGVLEPDSIDAWAARVYSWINVE